MIYKNGIIKGNEFNENYANLNIVGSPTINNGVVSGFSTSKYLQTHTININPKKSWEVIFKITTGSISSIQNIVAGLNSTTEGIIWGIYNSGYLTIYASSNGTNWDISNGKKSSQIFSENTTYYIKTTFDTTKYVFQDSLDGINYSTRITIETTKTIYNMSSFYLGISRVISLPFLGSIDLNELVFKQEDKVIWTPSLNTSLSEYQVTSTEFYEI